MSQISPLTRFALVRMSHSEESVWRSALGRHVPLRVAITEGPLDAPEWMPAGSAVMGPSSVPVGKMVSRPGRLKMDYFPTRGSGTTLTIACVRAERDAAITRASDLHRANVNLTCALAEAREERDAAIAERDAAARSAHGLGRANNYLTADLATARTERDALRRALEAVVCAASPIGYHAEGGIGGNRAPVYHPAIDAARAVLNGGGL